MLEIYQLLNKKPSEGDNDYTRKTLGTGDVIKIEKNQKEDEEDQGGCC